MIVLDKKKDIIVLAMKRKKGQMRDGKTFSRPHEKTFSLFILSQSNFNFKRINIHDTRINVLIMREVKLFIKILKN